MRFCMVTTFYPPYHLGGDAVYVQALARAVRRAGPASWTSATSPSFSSTVS